MPVSFRFSYIGLLFLGMLFIPNLLWSKNKPRNYERYCQNENRILLLLERIGEALVTVFSLIFCETNSEDHAGRAVLLLAFLLMIGYEFYWIRYFKSGKTMRDMYRSLCGIPVAGATLPVAAFLLLGLYGKNPFLLLSTLILGVGHIGIHLGHKKEADCETTDGRRED